MVWQIVWLVCATCATNSVGEIQLNSHTVNSHVVRKSLTPLAKLLIAVHQRASSFIRLAPWSRRFVDPLLGEKTEKNRVSESRKGTISEEVMFSDHESYCLITVPIGEEVRARDILFELEQDHLTLGVKGKKPIIQNEKLWGRIVADDSLWQIEDDDEQRCVIIELAKRDSSEWLRLFEQLHIGDSPVMAKSLRVALDQGCAAALAAGHVHCERSFCSPELVLALRRDLEVLRASFSPAESLSTDGKDDDFREALRCAPINSDAFDVLLEQLEDIREQLQILRGRSLSSGFEGSYVMYPPGGYYRRHIDSKLDFDKEGTGRREVSFICYLPDPSQPWKSSDGGQLRCFSDGSTEQFKDVLPECGALVMFDSKALWHEVLPTSRERACFVGWFREA